ncbi:MAG: DUF1097 domain-containing protein [Bacillota bacterium]|jgi:hypothetical protein
MKSRIPIELVVPVLAAISCLLMKVGVGLPVWAVFLGWAWYFALGATPSAFKQIYPVIIPGAVLAGLCFWLMGFFAQVGIGGMPGTMLSVFITVVLLMLMLRIPATSASLPAFNAYSTVFALYVIPNSFPDLGVNPILSCVIWAIIANALGPIFGYLSIYLTFPAKVEEEQKKQASV